MSFYQHTVRALLHVVTDARANLRKLQATETVVMPPPELNKRSASQASQAATVISQTTARWMNVR